MDNFEEFIRAHREDLDRYEASPATWEKISRRTGHRGRKILLRYTAAATILLAVGIALFFNMNHRSIDTSSGVSLQNQQELRETEYFYNSMFNSMYTAAKPLLTSQPIVEKELNDGVAQIDSICADLRKDLKDNVSNTEVIEALIRNYRIKIQLLEDMLDVVRQNENDDKKPTNHEL
jgi:CHASE3 domain sensor protein